MTDARRTAEAGQERTVVVGGGPAGLTAAYELAVRRGLPVTVYEASGCVGGISRTEERDGYRFDLGGHRFFTRVPEVEALWDELLDGEGEFLTRPRLSRIYYDGHLFDYPLKPVSALRGLGLLEAVRCVLSYLWVRVNPPADQGSFEGWVAGRFGWRLYRIFFKTYTEKVWGMPATEIKADWAAQRIKDLSLGGAIRNALVPTRFRADHTSLIEEFRYPRLGPGMMWERAEERVVEAGGEVARRSPVVAVERDVHGATAVRVQHGGRVRREPVDRLISTMPLAQLAAVADPPAPPHVLEAAAKLRYRDFLTVSLVVPEGAAFPDNWVYVHTPGLRVGRVQNFGSWSPYLVQDGHACLGLEYFVDEGDELWRSDDADLVRLASAELEALGLCRAEDVEAGYVVRVPKAYPVYDDGYAEAMPVLRAWLADALPNVRAVGRNGMHKYNNQDHSMLTAMLAVEELLDGEDHDLWSVNTESQYHEERLAPQRRDGGPGVAAQPDTDRPDGMADLELPAGAAGPVDGRVDPAPARERPRLRLVRGGGGRSAA